MGISFVLALCIVMNFVLPFGYLVKTKQKSTGKVKAVMGLQVAAFFGLVLVATAVMFIQAPTNLAMAAETAASGAASEAGVKGWQYIAAAISTGLGSIGAGVAVASAASAALGALSEDSKIMGKALIFVALAEGVAIYGLLISLLILFA